MFISSKSFLFKHIPCQPRFLGDMYFINVLFIVLNNNWITKQNFTFESLLGDRILFSHNPEIDTFISTSQRNNKGHERRYPITPFHETYNWMSISYCPLLSLLTQWRTLSSFPIWVTRCIYEVNSQILLFVTSYFFCPLSGLLSFCSTFALLILLKISPSCQAIWTFLP